MMCQFCSEKGVLICIYVDGKPIYICIRHFKEHVLDGYWLVEKVKRMDVKK